MAAEIGVGEQALGRWVRLAGEVSDADNNGVALNAGERPERVLLSEENAELRSGRQLLKDPQPSSPPNGRVEAYRVIEAEKVNFAIVRMTGLPEASRSGFYKWRTVQVPGPTPAQRRRYAIDAKVAAFP